MSKCVMSLLMAAAMVLSMAACGSTEKPAEKPAENKPAVNTPAATTPAAPTTPAEKPAEVKDTFTIGITAMPENLAPSATGMDDVVSLKRPISDLLFMENPDGSLDYYLADKVEISEDGKTYSVHLNEKATWSDGTPITSKDVKFFVDYQVELNGFNRIMRLDGKDPVLNIIDDHNFEFVLEKPNNMMIIKLRNVDVLPSHIFDGDPKKMIENMNYFNTPGFVTSGAYVVTEINEDSFVCEARDDYYRGTPEVKRVIMKVVGMNAKAVAFENGEIDYMRITTVDELNKYSAQSDKYTIFSMPEARVNYMCINKDSPNNLDLAQRQAIFYALNGDEIIDFAYGTTDLAQNPNSLLAPQQSLYNPDTKDYEFDLEKAKQLAKESGLEGKTLTYIYNKDRANMYECAVVVQQQLAQIGVNVLVEGIDSSAYFNRFNAISKGNGLENTWDLGANGWDSMRGSSINYLTGTFTTEANNCGLAGVCSELATELNTSTDPAKRQELADKVIEAAMAEYRVYPLTYTNFVMVAQKNVGGLANKPIVPEFIDYLEISVNN